jgi:hypothetical protein
MNTLHHAINNFNGISLLAIMILSYCAVLKSTQRNTQGNTQRHQSATK